MESQIFKYIIRHSKPQQLFLLLLTALSFPFLYLSLDLPKTIINEAIGGTDFPRNYFGYEITQLPYLFTLCGLFLLLVCVNGWFKYFINVFRGGIGERMLRRLRYQLIQRVLRFPLPHFRNVSQGEVVSMVATETEPLGGFIGDAFSLPTFQGGTLLTILFFMFMQDPTLGLAAIALYPIQGYMIPKLQRRVNLLGKERVKNVRKLSERLGEMVSGVQDIHAHDTGHYELADFGGRLGAIFQIRIDIYRKKFFIKFINNFLAQLTPFLFYAIGGYLVIAGDLTFGALVAILAAYKDLSAPWKELLTYYQRMEDARIKYSQLVEQFEPAGMMEEDLVAPSSEPPATIEGTLAASNLSLEEEDGTRIVEGASFSFDTAEHVALVGPGGSGKTELAQLVARQLVPSGGQILVADKNLSSLPEAVTGRRFAYVDQEAYIRSGSIRDGLFYGLKHVPTREAAYDDETRQRREKELRDSVAAGNSPYDIEADWIDYDAIGASDGEDLTKRAIAALRTVELDGDVFQLGLRRIIDPAGHGDLVASILEARTVVREKLSDPEMANLVELFDVERFNSNASVAENILFGSPVDGTFELANLGNNAFVTEVLEKVGLTGDFLEMGRSIAAIMVELFRDLPPGHEFFERFGFIEADDLPEFQGILNRAATHGLDTIEGEDKARLVDLPFKLIPARHRLEVIDAAMQDRILEARRVFADSLSDELRQSIEFFDAGAYNAAVSIQDNVLFGKIAGTQAESVSRIGELLTGVIDDLGLRAAVLEVGLEYDVGIAGKRLSATQRQKLAIARCLLKRPQIMIVNEATAAFDASGRAAIFEGIKEELAGRGLVWVDNELDGEERFDHVLAMDRGRVARRTTLAEGTPPAVAAPDDAGEAAEPEKAAGLSQEAEVLAKVPFFAGMDRSRLKLLAFTSERLQFDPGQELFRQGDAGDRAFVIIQGSVDIIVDTSDGPKTIANRGAGELIGELALLCDAPRTATVRVTDDVTVLSISEDVFISLIREDNEVSANLARILAGRLESTMRTLIGG
jgi:putative ABC transport system ATP-binding protein